MLRGGWFLTCSQLHLSENSLWWRSDFSNFLFLRSRSFLREPLLRYQQRRLDMSGAMSRGRSTPKGKPILQSITVDVMRLGPTMLFIGFGRSIPMKIEALATPGKAFTGFHWICTQAR